MCKGVISSQCPKSSFVPRNNTNELALPLLINGKSHPLSLFLVIKGRSAFWMNGIGIKDAPLCVCFQLWKRWRGMKKDRFVAHLLQWPCSSFLASALHKNLLTTKYQLKVSDLQWAEQIYATPFFIFITILHNQMKPVRKSAKIKGDTANSAGRHQTWVFALTFTMTIEQSNSQGELY